MKLIIKHYNKSIVYWLWINGLPEPLCLRSQLSICGKNYGKKGAVCSLPLQELLAETLRRGEQGIILLNRRGYATFVMCRECGHIIKCKHCDISMVYHSVNNLLRCHYCQRQLLRQFAQSAAVATFVFLVQARKIRRKFNNLISWHPYGANGSRYYRW